MSRPDDTTRPAQNEQVNTTEQAKPRLPHEHDESADSQETANPDQEQVGRQAHEDVQRGLKDTDRGPVLDKAYRRQTTR